LFQAPEVLGNGFLEVRRGGDFLLERFEVGYDAFLLFERGKGKGERR
jgi:hypothetical protein